MKPFFSITILAIGAILGVSTGCNNCQKLQTQVDSLQTVITHLQGQQAAFVNIDSSAFGDAVRDTTHFIASVALSAFDIHNIASYYKSGMVRVAIASDDNGRRYLLAGTENDFYKKPFNPSRFADESKFGPDSTHNCFPPTPNCTIIFKLHAPYTQVNFKQ